MVYAIMNTPKIVNPLIYEMLCWIPGCLLQRGLTVVCFVCSQNVSSFVSKRSLYLKKNFQPLECLCNTHVYAPAGIWFCYEESDAKVLRLYVKRNRKTCCSSAYCTAVSSYCTAVCSAPTSAVLPTNKTHAAYRTRGQGVFARFFRVLF